MSFDKGDSNNDNSNGDVKYIDNIIYTNYIINITDCEKFLFGDINQMEIKNLIDTDLDNQLFEKFKGKFKDDIDDNIIDELFKGENSENDDLEDLKDLEDLDITEIDNLNFDHINKYKNNISLEEAVEDFRAGYEDAFDYIYCQYKPKLIRYGKRYNDEDLAMELLDIVLLNAAKTFDSTNRTKFNTYFWTCAHNHVNCYRTRNNAQKRSHNKDMQSLNEKCNKSDDNESELGSKIEDPNSNDDKINNELKLSINALSDCLKSNEIMMLQKLIDNYTLQEIGEDLGVTAAAICMALKRIGKKPKAIKQLNEILKN